jgi:thiol:disulfide interchange protein
LPIALLLAFLGGLILNLMPCVFPVLSIKALSLHDHAKQSPLRARLEGASYTSGVLLSFVALASVLIALRAGGAQVGWGFQFQSPFFVLLVAYLMFVVGLSLSGVFYLGGSIAGIGGSLASRSGYGGSFFTGVLAVIVATPCTAPFMGAALGYALSQPAVSLLAVFISLGLGLAAPYLLLSCWPGLQRLMPKPGAWMDTLKQAFAFPMYATAVWLLWVLAQQSGPDAVAAALGGMVVIAFAAWLYNGTRQSKSLSRKVSSVIAATAVVAALFVGYANVRQQSGQASPSADSASRDWEPYSAARLQALQSQGAPIFLNMTAAWCITCLVNERVALSDASVRTAFKESEVVYLKGDWTQRDTAITELLGKFGRSGVPLYVFYPPGVGSKPVVLPQILTPDIVLSTLKPRSIHSL